MNKTFRLSALIIMIIFFLSCEEKPTSPVITTSNVSEITTTTAVSGGVITDDGGASIISKGICWNTSDNPTTDNSSTTETGESTSFTSTLTDLSPKTLYYVRAYATNSAGTGYGKSVSFTTLGDTPVVVAANATNIAIDSAVLNGTVNPNSLSTTVSFEWGTTTGYGNTVTAMQSPVTGSTSVSVSADLTGLAPGTTYHFRVVATNELGTTNSTDLTFTTLGQVPTVLAPSTTNLKVNTVTLNGSVNPNYLSTTVVFEWGTTTGYGNTITALQSPLTGSTPASINADLSGLTPETTYHFRIKATNILGTVFGEDLTFKTFAAIDADGNGYFSVIINTQTWMAKNLETSKYNNGDLIGTTNPSTLDISGESTPKYQWASWFDENKVSTYGRLYTWHAAVDSRGICPTGWHVPSLTDWITLIDFLGGEAVAGSKLKETGTSHWNNNTDATNESGFTALAGGMRILDGSFWGAYHAGVFWTTTPSIDPIYARTIFIYGDRTNIDYASQEKIKGQSIRCIKD